MSQSAKPTQGARPGFSILISPDSRLLLDELDAMLAQSPGNWEKQSFWGDEPLDSRFWSALRQQGLFGGNRAVVIRRANELPAAVWKELSALLSHSFPEIWPFLCLEGERDKGKDKIPAHVQRTSCYSFAQKKGWIWSAPALSGANLRRYVGNQAKKMGLRLDADAMSRFCGNAPQDASAIASELGKLAMLAKNGEVEAWMLESSHADPEKDAFTLLRRLQAGDLPGAWPGVASANASSLLFFLVALLAKEFRVLWQLECGETPWLSPQESSFKKGLSKRLGKPGISSGFSALADAEWQVKSGRLSPEQALERLAIRMALLFSGKNVE